MLAILSETNICIDCANGFAHRCAYIKTGTPNDNQTYVRGKHGVKILSCKRFEKEDVQILTGKELLKLLGLQGVKKDYSSNKIRKIALKKGYLVTFDEDKNAKQFFVKKVKENEINRMLQRDKHI